jgi:Xaa-Pro aminopeptidase
MNLVDKLTQLREVMQQASADYYYIPAQDQHKNEYVPDCWQRRAWISDFTGSAGDALVGLKDAYLWTDPRYFLQAEDELDSQHYQLMKQLQGTPPVDQWLLEQEQEIVLAVDPKLININQAERLEEALAHNGGELLPVERNFIDEIWQDQPDMPFALIRVYPSDYSGKTAKSKLKDVRAKLEEAQADTLVVSMLDNIAWLYNIRGNDVAFNPLVLSYAIITMDRAELFVDPEKVTPEVAAHLAENGITVRPYETVADELKDLEGVWVDPNETSLWVEQQLEGKDLLLQANPILMMKAVKNDVEQQNMREVHRVDAVAVMKFLHWIESNWQSGVNELTAAQQLEAFRREDARCLDLSFTTISGFGPHGAIVHYSVDESSSLPIDDSNMYLIDSGGQYLLGTTDITRTIHLGTPTAEQKRHYTLVLQAHLALRHLKFPHGMCGEHLNVVSHAPLWDDLLDFGHGTGHGVGCYLCVHEGPQSIANRNTGIPLIPGMIVSNEPGVYFTGKYGIRIENLCLIHEIASQRESATSHGPFYSMDDLTLVPYATKLIEVSMLSEREKLWVNQYHTSIREQISERLASDELKQWLVDSTQPI